MPAVRDALAWHDTGSARVGDFVGEPSGIGRRISGSAGIRLKCMGRSAPLSGTGRDRMGRLSRCSQADSAGSIPVTRSNAKAQAGDMIPGPGPSSFRATDGAWAIHGPLAHSPSGPALPFLRLPSAFFLALPAAFLAFFRSAVIASSTAAAMARSASAVACW